MQIHQLTNENKKSRKRVGRGGKRGTYSGRGCKGQKSRSGGNVDPLFEGGRSSLIERLKKTKGFLSSHAKKKTLALSVLDAGFVDGDTVTVDTLYQKKIITLQEKRDGVKLLNSGTIQKKLTIGNDVLLSEGAAQAIEKAGGKVHNT